MQHLRRRQQRGIVIETLVDHAEQVNILQNIQVVVGGCAVRAERDIDALLPVSYTHLSFRLMRYTSHRRRYPVWKRAHWSISASKFNQLRMDHGG